MNRIDKAVHDLKGVLPDLVHPAQDARSIDVGSYFLLSDNVHFKSRAGVITSCTEGEFEKRASELGYINGYRYGIEYPTDGKKPDLPDDVVVEMRRKNGSWHEDGEDELNQFHHRSFSAFKITDERYKPKDTSYLDNHGVGGDNKEIAKSVVVNSEDWYDYETQKTLRLPPVGVECEANNGGNSGYFYCEVVAYHFKSGRPILKTKNSPIYTLTEAPHCWNFRPLDWNRKAEAERKRVVDAAVAIVVDANITEDVLGFLYDEGYLRMPADKD